MTFPLAVSPLKYLYFETSSWKTKGFSAVVIPPQSGWDLKVILLSQIAAWAAPCEICSVFFSTPARELEWEQAGKFCPKEQRILHPKIAGVVLSGT